MSATRAAASAPGSGAGIVLTLIAVALLSAGSARAAFPGPNGRIAFSADQTSHNQIFSVNSDGTGLSGALTSESANSIGARWSPDGTKLVGASYASGSGQIYVVNADGSGPTNVSNNAFYDQAPSWSPDGSKIVFERLNASYNAGVYVMNADGSGQTQITAIPSGGFSVGDFNPVWSPNGAKIAFTRYVQGNNLAQIYTMNPDGASQTNITNSSTYFSDGANWSPDSARIVFSASKPMSSDTDIFVMNADGTGQINLTNTTATNNLEPTFSPDGTQIAFVREPNTANQHYDLFVIGANGSGAKDITNTPTVDERAPDWGRTPAAPPPGTSPPPSSGTSLPSISGSAVLGQTLTEGHATWTGSPSSYTYQWELCDGSGANCSTIAGATGQTYVLTTGVGHTIRVQENATNIGGTGGPATSAQTAVLAAVQVPPRPVGINVRYLDPYHVLFDATYTAGTGPTMCQFAQGQLSGTRVTWQNYAWFACGAADHPSNVIGTGPDPRIQMGGYMQHVTPGGSYIARLNAKSPSGSFTLDKSVSTPFLPTSSNGTVVTKVVVPAGGAKVTAVITNPDYCLDSTGHIPPGHESACVSSKRTFTLGRITIRHARAGVRRLTIRLSRRERRILHATGKHVLKRSTLTIRITPPGQTPTTATVKFKLRF